jgi:hypothetical protein
MQTNDQRADMAIAARGVDGAGVLDYVCGWYFKAMAYTHESNSPCAFVSTNSITQGEQAGILWPPLFRDGAKIQFGHRTFAWCSEAKGKAHVHVVIVGFGRSNPPDKRIYDYDSGDQHGTVSRASNISPYLIDGPDDVVRNRSRPLCNVPEIGIGNKPIDGGNYLFTAREKELFLAREPAAAPFFREWYGSDEFINGYNRWCLWLGDCPPEQLRRMPQCLARVDNVRRFRQDSKSKPTNALAGAPTRFHVENMPAGSFLIVPKVSSERRTYIPIGFMSPPTLVSDLVFVIPNASLYEFGVLSSMMHMAWVRQVCGRLKSDYRYSGRLVYNNYPWPEPTPPQRDRVANCAQAVLDARQQFPASTMADLYDPLATPLLLANAHKDLDTAVDRCYRSQPFVSDRQRFEYLFALYELLVARLRPARPEVQEP